MVHSLHLFREWEEHNEKGKAMDYLRNILLTHWQNYHPKMLSELQAENRLEETLTTTARHMADLLDTLIIVHQMSYPSAWEIAIDQFLLPEEETDDEAE